MLNENQTIIKGHSWQKYVVSKSIDPIFSAVHTKLAKDNLNLEQGLLYLLGNGYSLEVVDRQLFFFNDTFINDLSCALGIYLEEYRYTNGELFYSEVKRNLKMNIAPPMVYFFIDHQSYLAIVIQVDDDRTYRIIHPVTKEVAEMPESSVDFTKPWLMMNSPRFAKPVFRDMDAIIRLSLRRFFQTRKQLRLLNEQTFIRTLEDTVIEALVKDQNYKNVRHMRRYFIEALEYVSKYFKLDLESCIRKMEEAMGLWEALGQSNGIVDAAETTKRAAALENEVINLFESSIRGEF